MSLKGYLAKLGFTTAAASSAAVLAFSAGSDLDAANRTGWYADIANAGEERYGIVVGGTETVNAQGSILSTGRLEVLYTTASADTATGALVVAGGVGIGGAAHVGEGLFVTGLLDTTNVQLDPVANNPGTTTTTLWVDSNGNTLMFGETEVIGGGGDIAGDIANTQVAFGAGVNIIGGDDLFTYDAEETTGGLSIGNTTPSIDIYTGALVVAGGVGIEGAAHVGDDLFVAGLLDTTNVQLDPVANNPGTPTTLWVDDDGNTLMFGETEVIGGGGGDIAGDIANTQVAFGAGVNIIGGDDLFTYVADETTGGLSIGNTTPSTDSTTGALTVTGGVGIGGSLSMDLPVGHYFQLGTATGTDDSYFRIHRNGDPNNPIYQLRAHLRSRFNENNTYGGIISHGADGGGGGGSGQSVRTAFSAFVTDVNHSIKWNTAIGVEGYVDVSAYWQTHWDADNILNIGVLGRGTTGGSDNATGRGVGVMGRGEVTGTLRRNYGGWFEALTAAGTNYGIYATASGGLVNNYAGYFDGALSVTGLLDVTNTTASTSTTTGALVVAGGVGIGGDLHVEGIVGTAIDVPRGSETSQGFGPGALESNTGNGNTASGYQALYSNTTGFSNTASGYRALYNNTTGGHNTASGFWALYSNTTGIRNTASGYSALHDNTTGHFNTASGYEALFKNTSGVRNTASGYWALSNNTTGNRNTASGHEAGRYTNGGGAAREIDDCVLLGHDTRVLAATDVNEIVIGSTARGNGSNTVTIGNDSITATHLRNPVIAGNMEVGGKISTNSTADDSIETAGGIAVTRRITHARIDKTTTNTAENNFDLGDAGFVHIIPQSGNLTISGFVAGAEGQRVYIQNRGEVTITLLNESGLSNAVNRVKTGMPGGGSVALRLWEGIDLVYTGFRWHVVGPTFGTDAVNTWTAGQVGAITTLVNASTIAIDLKDSNNFQITLAGNHTLGNPDNIQPGQSGLITVTQDGSGGREMDFGSLWKFAGGDAPVLSIAAGAVDVLAYYVINATTVVIGMAEEDVS